ncbi:MAG: Zn-dependent hydrolase [Pseudomonadota bacterium]
MTHRLVALAGLVAAVSLGACAQTALPRADAARLEGRIEALSQFGANEDGGVDRVAYSDADLAGRDWIMGEMEALGLADIHIDAGGNITGRRAGTDGDAKPIMFGSHIDSVLGGGNYDGPAGVLTALEAVELLNEADIATRSPLDLIVFANEEGGLIGSLALTGRLSPGAFRVVSDSGYTIEEGTKRIGGDLSQMANDVISKGDLKGFVELHIEQGAFLEEENIDIGVVQGIVGIEWWDVTLRGMPNHAGTTPMNRRRDALLAAAKLTQAVNEVATGMEGRQVATVGRIEAFPGAPNVIPGRVEMSLEVRDLETERIEQVYDEITARANAISAESGVEISFERLELASEPALTDPAIRDAIAAAAEDLGLSYKFMPSGAGHDAQDMAGVAPTGMIFVPSKGGISHSPEEFTSAQDLANGADVIVRALLAIDAF